MSAAKLKRGIVFKRSPEKVVALFFDDVARGGFIEYGFIEYSFPADEYYKEMPMVTAEIVELSDENDVLHMIDLHSICAIDFFNNKGVPVLAHEAITQGIIHDPERIKRMVCEAGESKNGKTELLKFKQSSSQAAKRREREGRKEDPSIRRF